MEEHWSLEDVKDAEEWMEEAVRHSIELFT
jgi:hypothetical protein